MKKSTKLLYGLGFATVLGATTAFATVSSVDGTAGAPEATNGKDATSGDVYESTVRATATLTLALPKTGLVSGPARTHVGELYLADIGVPRQLYSEIDLPDPGAFFAKSDLVRLAR